MTARRDRLVPLSAVTYDRAALHREDDAWLAEAWQRARILLLDQKSTTPVSPDGTIAFSSADHAPPGPRRFLGMADDVPYFSVTVGAPTADGWQTLRQYGPRVDELQAGLAVSAVALEEWHRRHTHCPMCGTPTDETRAGWTRTCPRDGSDHFPRTDPAVIMLIHDGADLALLGRGHQWGAGRFSTLAGFVEPGESLEAAVAREVFEEVGVGVRDVRYLASQPWPFPASLMLGFVARLDGDPSLHLDPVEMAEAGWFNRTEIRQAADWTDHLDSAPDPDRRLRGIPPHFSISRYLIDEWLEGRV
ncbi:MAG TPA: NAD(+) diphosphatase [Jatrophihabitans sp.]|nr:NAD(+) diphosphatase [Jatrophihabitans sp.]